MLRKCRALWFTKHFYIQLEKTLESPLDCKEIQPVHSEGDQPWDFCGRNDAEAETSVLWPPHAKSWLIGKDWCWEGLGAGGEGDAKGWDGWMASLTRWTWVSVNSGSWWWTGRSGVLRFMGSWRVGHNWATELNWTEVTSVVSDSMWPHRRQPTRLPRSWDSPGKNTGVDCHFLLHYICSWTEKNQLHKIKRRSYKVKKKRKTEVYNVKNLGRMWLKLKCYNTYILRERRIIILIDLDFDKCPCLPDFLSVTEWVGTGWLPSLPYTVCSSSASRLLYLTQGYTSGWWWTRWGQCEWSAHVERSISSMALFGVASTE